MDEPFGALDPITRGTLQEELRRIHRMTGKTILFVTHDMDEALRLADRIVILHEGRLVQAGTPRDIVERPAGEFVRDFVGRAELGLKRLAVRRVGEHLRPGEAAGGAPVEIGASLRDALSEMALRGVDRLAVRDADGRPAGAILLRDIVG
jgi:osmoprotectant transport system ATP-binding protein